MSAPLVNPGDMFAGKYRVEQVLGSGSMGVVVAARHTGLDQKVAIKLLRPEATADKDLVARFEREGRAAAKIESQHVARVMDVGTHDSIPYLVMEHLDGTDLARSLRANGRVPIFEAIRYVREACEAVAEAHEAGIIHRDLKPANLFLAKRKGARAIVKVLDFGISKQLARGSEQLSLTATGAFFGSPLYMSPEQLNAARDLDHRTDIWALGVVLYELLTARVPFDATSLATLVQQIMTSEPPRVRSLRPEVPPGLEAVILRCMSKDRTRRWPSATALSDALAPFADPSAIAEATTPEAGAPHPQARTLPLASRPAPAAPAASAAGESTRDNAWGGTQGGGRKGGPPRWAAGLAFGVLAVSVGGAVAYRRTSAPATMASAYAPETAPSMTAAPPSTSPASAAPPDTATPAASTSTSASASASVTASATPVVPHVTVTATPVVSVAPRLVEPKPEPSASAPAVSASTPPTTPTGLPRFQPK